MNRVYWLLLWFIFKTTLRRGSAGAPFLGLRVRIPPVARMSCECCVLSGRGLCFGLITRPEVVCLSDRQASILRDPYPLGGGDCRRDMEKKLKTTQRGNKYFCLPQFWTTKIQVGCRAVGECVWVCLKRIFIVTLLVTYTLEHDRQWTPSSA